VLDWLDRAAVHAAHFPCVDTAEHRERVCAAARGRAVVVPVGAPSDWFYPPVQHASERVRVVFFGSFTPLQGAPVIGEALRLLADDERFAFTIVGRGQDYEETRAVASAANVEWVDWVEPEYLPYLVACHDVCLGIFGTGPKALRVVPNKAFQGAAAGTAIVTSDTAPQRQELGNAAVYVPAGDASALAAELRRLAGRPRAAMGAAGRGLRAGERAISSGGGDRGAERAPAGTRGRRRGSPCRRVATPVRAQAPSLR
jgi:glycosyltransferase involved in cell wall biosynthesis